MRWDDLYINATGLSLPPEVTIAAALADGRYDEYEAVRTQQLAVTVAAPEQSAPHLAVSAARQAVSRSGFAGEDVDLILHAVTLHAGLDYWNSGSYIQDAIQAPGAPCVVAEVRSACAGGLVSLELACSHLKAHPDAAAALLTAAECWPDRALNRWHGVSGYLIGDGASALVVSRVPGRARICAIATTTDSSLEGLQRGNARFGSFSPDSLPIDVHGRRKAFLEEMPQEEVFARLDAGLQDVVRRVITDAGIDLADIEYAAYSFLGRRLLHHEFLNPLGLDVSRTTWEFGRRIGHIGAPDAFASIDNLITSGRLAQGEHALVVAQGTGVIWTAAIIQGC